MARFNGLIVTTALAVLTATEASAQRDDAGFEDRASGSALWVAHGESDNIGRTDARLRGSYDALGVLFEARRVRERLTAGLDTDLQFRQYSLEGLDDEQIGEVEAYADVIIVPERFTWIFGDGFSQGRTDAFSAVGPENRQNINIITSGPEVDVLFGRRVSLSLDGLYTARKHEETKALDAESLGYEAGLFRETGTTSRWGVVATQDDVDYDDGSLSYTIRGAAIRYERILATGEVLAELGRNELRLADTRESGPRALLAWRRGIGPRSRLSITATREFTDTSAMFALTPERSLVTDPSNGILAADAMEQTRLELLYELDGAKTDVAIGVSSNEDRFRLDSTLDNDGFTVRWEVQRMLSGRTTLTVGAENVQRTFVGTVGTEGDRVSDVSLDHRLGRRLTCEAIVRKYQRSAADSFDELQYELRLNYRPVR
jgi:hypothetical protein